MSRFKEWFKDVELNEKESLNRPAWTSTVETGNFEAYKHKHSIINGKFHLILNFFEGKTQ